MRQQLEVVESEKEELKSMLKALHEGYNPNYQVWVRLWRLYSKSDLLLIT